MVSLLDVAPTDEVLETVTLRGKKIPVPGISSKGVVHLLGRFPDLGKLLSRQEVTADRLISLCGEAIGAVIAAGLGFPGHEAAETIAEGLSLDEQVDCLAKILKRTMPQGVGPFGEKVSTLIGILSAEPVIKVRAMKSPKPSNGSSRSAEEARPTSGA